MGGNTVSNTREFESWEDFETRCSPDEQMLMGQARGFGKKTSAAIRMVKDAPRLNKYELRELMQLAEAWVEHLNKYLNKALDQTSIPATSSGKKEKTS